MTKYDKAEFARLMKEHLSQLIDEAKQKISKRPTVEEFRSHFEKKGIGQIQCDRLRRMAGGVVIDRGAGKGVAVRYAPGEDPEKPTPLQTRALVQDAVDFLQPLYAKQGPLLIADAIKFGTDRQGKKKGQNPKITKYTLTRAAKEELGWKTIPVPLPDFSDFSKRKGRQGGGTIAVWCQADKLTEEEKTRIIAEHMAAAPGPAQTTTAGTATVKTYPALGIEVDLIAKTVRENETVVPFARSEVEWHILNVALSAYPNAYTLEALKKDYPGEAGRDSRAQAKASLNRKLNRIGLH